MAFTKQRILPTETTLSPSLETPALLALVEYLNLRIDGTRMTVDDKPQVVVCFDTSGSGKTTTVREAARRVGANRVIISPIFSPILAGVLSSCYNRNQFEIDEDGFIDANCVVERYEMKFNSALEKMFECIITLLTDNQSLFEAIVDEGDFESPNSSLTNLHKSTKSLFKRLCTTNGDRKLIIHVDDCQRFFKEVIPTSNHRGDKIPASEIMSLALRCFSNCITRFAKRDNIIWVFSGTRPSLRTEITLTSNLKTEDISADMTDLSAENIQTIIGNYYDLSSIPESSSFPQLCERLQGPPKLVYFFIKAASKHRLTSPKDLIDSWAEIEESAVAAFKTEIDSTFRGNFDQVARNLCLLHTIAVTLNQGFIDIPSVSRHLIHLIESGLLRIHKRNRLWRIFAPNRFLIQIFQEHVRWYTWERVAMLKSLIHSSSYTTTQIGKVFEYLFALELCNSPNSKLWKFISQNVHLHPIPSWNPVIKRMEHLWDCTDKSCIYVMVDPDRVTTKIDVVFFAVEMDTGKDVRVVVQLTISSCSLKKATDSFDCMLNKVEPFMELKDYRLFIGPKSTAASSSEETNFYKDNYSCNRCFTFLKSSLISQTFELPVEQICDPKSTDESVALLINMAEKLGDSELADHLAGDLGLLSISNKRQRVDEQVVSNPVVSFDTMDEFYTALIEDEKLEEDEIEEIKTAFKNQKIKVHHLPRLTDEKLEKYGIMQGGIRESILTVLGK